MPGFEPRRSPSIVGFPRGRRARLVLIAVVALAMAIPAAIVSAETPSAMPVSVVGQPGTAGYWAAWSDGRVEGHDAPHLGDLRGVRLQQPVVGIAATPSGNGYWMVASDGGVFSFGDATFHGSTGSIRLNQPIVGMTASKSGNGYWMVASDGGVFSFGDATFHGSTGSIRLNQPIVGMTASKSGNGYWMVASDGGVFSFGDAAFYGSTGGNGAQIRSITRTPAGDGYWFVTVDGTIYTMGDAGNGAQPSVVLGAARDGNGWKVLRSPAADPPGKPSTTTSSTTSTTAPKPTTTTTAPVPTTTTTAAPTTTTRPPTTTTTQPPTTTTTQPPTTTTTRPPTTTTTQPPTTTTTTPPPPTNTVSPPASIDRTGTQDVTSKLQTFFNGVDHGETIVFPAGAKYRIEGTVEMQRKNDITIDGKGALFFATDPRGTEAEPRERSQFDFRDMSNLVIENMVIRGAHPNGGLDEDAYVAKYEAQHGINIAGGERIEIRNNRITDVYGDFIYVGRSDGPIYGTSTDVWIHDNYMRRNGRQGVSATHGFNVVIERNDIGDNRRAVIDLEPPSVGSTIRNVWIRNNRIGAGRLMFVAGHGAGNVSDVYIQNNTLVGRPMNVDFVAPLGTRRQNIVMTGNTSNDQGGSERGSIVRFVGYDHVDVRNNVQPVQPNRDMVMAGFMRTCGVTVSGNDLRPNGVGQMKYLDTSPFNCAGTLPLVTPTTPSVFSGDRLVIDVGGLTSAGMVACPQKSSCGGYIVAGSGQPLVASGGGTTEQRTMLHGNLSWDIPIRGGTYDVTLSFIEPTLGQNARRFHYDIDGVRKESGLDVSKLVGGPNRLMRRTHTVTIGDGVLDLRFLDGGTGSNDAIVSVIDINRK